MVPETLDLYQINAISNQEVFTLPHVRLLRTFSKLLNFLEKSLANPQRTHQQKSLLIHHALQSLRGCHLPRALVSPELEGRGVYEALVLRAGCSLETSQPQLRVRGAAMLSPRSLRLPRSKRRPSSKMLITAAIDSPSTMGSVRPRLAFRA